MITNIMNMSLNMNSVNIEDREEERNPPDKQIDVDVLRKELLLCPSLDPESDAMQVALASEILEDTRSITIATQGYQQRQNGTLSSPSLVQPSKSPDLSSLRKVKSKQILSNKNSRGDITKSASSRIKKIILQIILIDLPLITFFILSIGTSSLSLLYQNYLAPQIQHMVYTDENRTRDLTYYHRVCELGQMSTTNAVDLYIGDDFTTEDCVEHMMVHGASLYRDIITPKTATSLREYIVRRNENLHPEDEIGVIENDHRWSFGIGATDHPSIADALHELSTHAVLRSALEAIVGPNPGVIEMTAITAGYGATDQYWHPDLSSSGSAAKYARNFLPSYSLFITLQNTTAAMGATGVCPGTYQCANEGTDTCETFGFQVANDNDNLIWSIGTGILMNQQSFHRGAAHVDPNAPDRVVFIVTFSPRRMDYGETRMLGHGGTYSTRWDMWGHTLTDLEDAAVNMVQPWTTLRALGLYKPATNANWGFDFISQMSMRCANFEVGFRSWTEFKDMMTIPKLFLVKYNSEKELPFSEYFDACIARWKTWARLINVVAVVSYLTRSGSRSSTDPSFSNRKFKGIFGSLIRVAIQYTLVAFLSFYIYRHYFMKSAWVQEIIDGRYMQSPYSAVDKLEHLLNREPIVIDESSILITDRFNFKFLNALIDSPKYHPGNMKLHSEIQGAHETFDFLNQEDRAVLADTIVDNAINGRSNFVVHNHDAIWVPLTLDEAKSYVTKELYLQNSPLLASMEKEASFLLAANRYGSSVMARRFSAVNINTLMDDIYATAYVPTFDIYRSAKKLDAKKSSRVFVEKSKPRSVSVFNLFNTNSIEIIRRNTKKIGKTSTTVVPRTQSHNKTLSTAQTLKVGDTVEGRYNGMYDAWCKGKIVKIYQGAIIDVEYTDGEVDYALGSPDVRKFVPYQVGEIVDAFGPGKEFYNDVTIIQKIASEYVVRTEEGDNFTVSELLITRFI